MRKDNKLPTLRKGFVTQLRPLILRILVSLDDEGAQSHENVHSRFGFQRFFRFAFGIMIY